MLTASAGVISAGIAIWVVPLREARAGFAVQATTYIVAIGVDKYPPESGISQVQFAEADASQLAPALADWDYKKPAEDHRETAKVEITPLLGADATVEHIRAAMRAIADKASPVDRFYFIFDGMGICSETERSYEFAAYDTVAEKDGSFRNGISAKDLRTMLMQIPAEKQYVIFDSCGSHKALNDLAAALQLPGQKSLKFVYLVAPNGASLETAQAGHGLLTAVFLDGLAGAADADHTGVITWDRLMGYLTWRLPEKTDGKEGIFVQTIFPDVAPEPPPTRGVDFASPSADAPADRPDDLGQDYALLIGTDHYANGWRTLHNAVGDVQAVHRELVRDYGFQDDGQHIVEIDDASKHAAERAMETLLGKKFGKRDRLLVYVAGHGLRTPLEGYVVFADSKLPKPGDDEDNATDSMMAFSYLSSALDRIQVNHELLVLDVCYGGMFDARTQFHSLIGVSDEGSAPRDELIRRALEAPSRIYITSGDENHQVSDGEPGQHSPFSRRFLSILEQNRTNPLFLDASTLYSGLRSLEREPRAGYFYASHAQEGADYLLIPKPAAASAGAASGR